MLHSFQRSFSENVQTCSERRNLFESWITASNGIKYILSTINTIFDIISQFPNDRISYLNQLSKYFNVLEPNCIYVKRYNMSQYIDCKWKKIIKLNLWHFNSRFHPQRIIHSVQSCDSFSKKRLKSSSRTVCRLS